MKESLEYYVKNRINDIGKIVERYIPSSYKYLLITYNDFGDVFYTSNAIREDNISALKKYSERSKEIKNDYGIRFR